jgi:transposase
MRRTKRPKRVNPAMPTVGMDLGETTSHATILTSDQAETFEFPMSEDGYALLKTKVALDARIAFESSGTAYPFWRQLRSMGYTDLTVAHPAELAWIVKSKKKNDRVDSVKLARLHSVGMLPEAHLLEREEQITRDLLLQRLKLGQEIGRLKSTIIGYLKREGVYQGLPDSTNHFSALRRNTIRGLSFGDERDLVLSSLMDRLEFAEKLADQFEERIRQRVKENDDVKLLMSIPGVNFYLASMVSSFIGDVRRFPDADHLASFFGIVPSERNSSSIKRVGHMSKSGPSEGRWALSLMVDTIAKYETNVRAYYAKAKARTRSGKMSHVLTMKKLVRMIYTMLSRREPWRWERESLTERKLADLKAN